MSHFTVGFHDAEKHYEICEYAENSSQALEFAKKDIPYLKANPDKVDRCTNESALDWLRS